MAQKCEYNPNQPRDTDRLLATEYPPSYSEVTNGYGLPVSNQDRSPLEDQIIVTPEEVNTAIAQTAPRTALTSEQRETIKRLTESILKRNVREQGVLPTALQREITLAHVVTKFNKTRLQQENVTAAPGPSISLPAAINYSVVTTPLKPSASNNRQILATWTPRQECQGTVTYTYADEVPRYTTRLTVLAVLCFFFASPLSLLCTIPSLLWILKVWIYTVHNTFSVASYPGSTHSL